MGYLRTDTFALREERPTTSVLEAPVTAPLSEKARAFGGNYLSKPLDIDDLLEEIGRIA